MQHQMSIYVDAVLYLEVISYIEDEKNNIDSAILDTFTDEEKLLLEKMKSNPQFSHVEFIVHSKMKDYISIIDFIKTIDIYHYAYYCSHEDFPLESFKNIDKEKWENDRNLAVSIIEKVHDYLSKTFKTSDYYKDLKELFDELNSRNPLDVSQDFLGKKFKRVSEYKRYYFVLLKYCSKPMRIFNNEELWTLIPTIDKREFISNSQLSRVMKIMGDLTRIKIIQLLSNDNLYGKQIADKIGITTATVSHHISLLQEVELLHMEKIGQIKYFTLNHKKYDSLLKSLYRLKNTQ